MKRLIRVFAVLVLLIFASAILLPIIFKDDIINSAKTELNKGVTATVDFQDIDVSLLRSFPDLSLRIEGLTIVGEGDFDGDTLLSMGLVVVDLDLMSVISGDNYEVESFRIENTLVNLLINEDGETNYDIMVADEESIDEPTNESEAEESDFKLQLKSYQIVDFNLNYVDVPGQTYAVIKELNHKGTGDFTQDIVNLSTTTSIDRLLVNYEDITYLNNVHAEMDADLSYHQQRSRIEFGENSLSLNSFPLSFSGIVELPADAVDLDLQVSSSSQGLKDLLSLIPAFYMEGYEELEASGNLAFSGFVKGRYDYADHYPEYNIGLKLIDGKIHYPDLPSSIDKINMDARIYANGSDLDDMVLDVSRASASVAGNPVSMRMILENSMTNPSFDMALMAKLDLNNLKAVMPTDGNIYEGNIDADMRFRGDMASIEKEDYQNLDAEGYFKAEAVSISGKDYPQKITMESISATLNPQNLVLSEFKAGIGSSDIQLRGSIDNLMGYALNDELLIGRFVLTSDQLNLNELSAMSETTSSEEPETSSEGTEGGTEALEVVRIPTNLDFSLASSIGTILYDNLKLENVQGTIMIKEGQAVLQDVAMNLLGGRLGLSGNYNSSEEIPSVDMNMNISGLSFSESFNSFNTVKKLAPIMHNAEGTYSTQLSFKSLLNEDMSPNLNSLLAKGKLQTKSLKSSPEVMQKLASTLKNPSFSNLSVKDLNLSYTVEGGRIATKPIEVKIGETRGNISGSMGIDQTLDYDLDMDVPIDQIPNADVIKGLSLVGVEKLKLKVGIGGTVTNPKITTDLAGNGKNLLDAAKDVIAKKVEEVKDDVVEQVNDKAEELIADAERKGDELIAEAKKQRDQIIAEAEKQAKNLRHEAERQATKLENDAKGNILKEQGAKIAATKLRDEADKQAGNLVSEAKKQGDKLVTTAEDQKSKLVQEARDKAKIQ